MGAVSSEKSPVVPVVLWKREINVVREREIGRQERGWGEGC